MGTCFRRCTQHQDEVDDLEQQMVPLQQPPPPELLTALVVVAAPADAAAPAAQTHLRFLDLPSDLLTEVLRHAPRSLRTTCHAIRVHLDAGRGSLTLRCPPDAPPTAAQLQDLLRRSAHLRSLDCSNAAVACTPLATLCPTLTALGLSGSRWEADLTRLASLPHLTSLTVGKCVDLMDLDGLTCLSATCRLSTLVLTNCTNLFDVSPLARFSALTHLDLTNTLWFSDLRPLAACSSLTSLALSTTGGGPVADLGRLTLLTSLSRLVLLCERTVNTEPLNLLTQLTSLTLSHSHLFQLHQLPLAALVTFDARLAKIDDIYPLAQCRSLASLSLAGCNQLRNLGPLSRCQGLTTLRLTFCNSVLDLSPLTACLSLEELHFTHCHGIARLDPLGRCPAHRVLSLTACPGVSRISELGDSSSLTSLALRRCCCVSPLDLANLLVRLELLRERKACEFIVDGKPAAAPLRVRAYKALDLTASYLLMLTFLAWLVGAQYWACVLCLFCVPATTLFIVFWAHGVAAAEYGA